MCEHTTTEHIGDKAAGAAPRTYCINQAHVSLMLLTSAAHAVPTTWHLMTRNVLLPRYPCHPTPQARIPNSNDATRHPESFYTHRGRLLQGMVHAVVRHSAYEACRPHFLTQSDPLEGVSSRPYWKATAPHIYIHVTYREVGYPYPDPDPSRKLKFFLAAQGRKI